MVLSQVGIIANVLLNEIPSHFPFVELDDFTVMPNHVHLVLIIDKPLMEGISVWAGQIAGPANLVSPGYDIALQQPSLQPQPSKQKLLLPGQNRFQHIGKNTISSIIGSYKSAVTKTANRLGYKHSWQPRFHDHIIRNDAEYQRISDYIISNPENWAHDKFNVKK